MFCRTTAVQFSKSARWIGASSFCLLLGGAMAPLAHGQAGERPITTRGLAVVDENGGQVVYDSNNRVYWLADANFAASPEGRKIQGEMGVTGIGPNGTMDYPTAQKWVHALNAYDHGVGWLGHHNWTLPASPMRDPTCGAMGPQGASFGGLCQGNALGKLYYVGLNRMLPDNVAPHFSATVGPFENMTLSYYWTAASGGLAGKRIFSFASGMADATTTSDSYYYVLPVVPQTYGPIGGERPRCPAGSAVVLYTEGPAANQAVYDCSTGDSWPANANLAASNAFGLTGNVAAGIEERRPYPRPPHPTRITAPEISGGAMLWETATRWVAAMNAFDHGAGYLGSNHWQLPDSPPDLRTLFRNLKLDSGDPRLMADGSVGPFRNLQPFFYWEECAPDPKGSGGSSADCAEGNAPSGRSDNQMDYDFTFGYGIQGTDAASLKYFVMVYYPGQAAPGKRP
jgi:hypothetical protein